MGEFCFQTRDGEREIEKKELSMIFVLCTGDLGMKEGRARKRRKEGKSSFNYIGIPFCLAAFAVFLFLFVIVLGIYPFDSQEGC